MFTKTKHETFGRLAFADLSEIGMFGFLLAVNDGRNQIISEINAIKPAWQEPVPHSSKWDESLYFSDGQICHLSCDNYWPNAIKSSCLPFDLAIDHPNTTGMDANDLEMNFQDVRYSGCIKIVTKAVLWVKIPPEEKELLKAIGNIHTNTYTSESISCSVPSAAVGGVPF